MHAPRFTQSGAEQNDDLAKITTRTPLVSLGAVAGRGVDEIDAAAAGPLQGAAVAPRHHRSSGDCWFGQASSLSCCRSSFLYAGRIISAGTRHCDGASALTANAFLAFKGLRSAIKSSSIRWEHRWAALLPAK